jgi:hypothetical protein
VHQKDRGQSAGPVLRGHPRSFHSHGNAKGPGPLPQPKIQSRVIITTKPTISAKVAVPS